MLSQHALTKFGLNFAAKKLGANFPELSWNLLKMHCWLGSILVASFSDKMLQSLHCRPIRVVEKLKRYVSVQSRPFLLPVITVIK